MAVHISPGFFISSPHEAAHCKLPLCPLPRPPIRLLRTMGIDKGKDRRKPPPIPYQNKVASGNKVALGDEEGSRDE